MQDIDLYQSWSKTVTHSLERLHILKLFVISKSEACKYKHISGLLNGGNKMSITSPEFVRIVWHDLGDVIYDQMKETVKDLKLTVFTGFLQ